MGLIGWRGHKQSHDLYTQTKREDVCYRHRQDELEHCQTDGRSIDKSASSQDKVCESPLAGVSRGKPLVGVLVITVICASC